MYICTMYFCTMYMCLVEAKLMYKYSLKTALTVKRDK